MFEEEVTMVENEISKRIQMRLNDNRLAFAKLNIPRFYIAGGALHKEEPNDYDLFPVVEKDFNSHFNISQEKQSNLKAKIWETPNAVTYKIDGITIQLCKFWKPTLAETVERFDFTHCKIGVEVNRVRYGRDSYAFLVSHSYVSPDYIRYRMLGYSEYNPKADCYPLSSLLRIGKYMNKGFIRSPYDVVFKILESFLERGYKSRQDFLDQLKGIDVGIDEAQRLTENAHILKHIYYLLTGDVIPQEEIVQKLMVEMGQIQNVVLRR